MKKNHPFGRKKIILFEEKKKTSTSTSRAAVLAEQRPHRAIALAAALSNGQRCVTVLQEGGVSIHVRVRVYRTHST